MCSFIGRLWRKSIGDRWVLSKGATVYPKKYAHGFCFAVLCCGYTLTDFPISIRLTSLALWQSNDCPSASKATLMNMEKHFIWMHYERLHNHNKAKHNKTVCIFLGIYCSNAESVSMLWHHRPIVFYTLMLRKKGAHVFRLHLIFISNMQGLDLYHIMFNGRMITHRLKIWIWEIKIRKILQIQIQIQMPLHIFS